MNGKNPYAEHESFTEGLYQSQIYSTQSPWKSVRKFLVLLIFPAVLFGVYLIVCGFWTRNQLIHLVNGTNVSYQLEINSTFIYLHAGQHRATLITEGTKQIRVLEMALDIPPMEVTIESSFLLRPFDHRVFVINPDRTAVIHWEEIGYSDVNTPAESESNYKFHVGELQYEFEDIDYIFENFPDSIYDSSSSDTVKKRRIGLIDLDTADNLYEFIDNFIDSDTAMQVLKNASRFELDDPHIFGELQNQLTHEQLLAFIQPELEHRPVLIEWHRAYQNSMERHEPETSLAIDYQKQSKDNSTDAAWNYLYFRTLDDPTESERQLRRVMELKDVPHQAIHSMLLLLMSSGRFSEAMEIAHQLAQIDPVDAHYKGHVLNTLMALNQFQEAMEYNDTWRKEDPTNFQTVLYQVELLVKMNQADSISNTIEDYCRSPYLGLDEIDIPVWRDSLKGFAMYVQGNEQDFGNSIDEEDDSSQLFQAAVSLGKLDEAMLLVDHDEDYIARNALIVYIQSKQLGNEKIAQVAVNRAVEHLHDRYRNDRNLAAGLSGEKEFDIEQILKLLNRTDDKRVVLTAMGLRDPAHQDRYFDLARTLNFSLRFPHLVIQRALGSAAD